MATLATKKRALSSIDKTIGDPDPEPPAKRQRVDNTALLPIFKDTLTREAQFSYTAQQIPEALKYLEEHGYVVITDILSELECADGLNLFWQWMEGLGTGVHSHDPATWNNDRWCPTFSTGVISHPATHVGHSKFMWWCRANPKVQRVFSKIWLDDNLISSFDGLGVFRPALSAYHTKATNTWWHFDQNGFVKKDLACVQGLLNFVDTTDSHAGTFAVVPDSHKTCFEPLFTAEDSPLRKDRKGTADWIPISKVSWDWLKEKKGVDLQPLRLGLPAGALLLWDSRTMHCNVPPKVSRDGGFTAGIHRLVAYLCMVPRAFASLQTQMDRLEYLKQGQTTNHWPHHPKVTKPNNRFWKREIPIAAKSHAEMIADGNVLTEETLTPEMRAVL